MTRPAAQPYQQPGQHPGAELGRCAGDGTGRLAGEGAGRFSGRERGPEPQPVYELRVRGVLEQRWSSWFDGLAIVAEPPDNCVLTGPVADQTALHGLLAKVRDLGLPLISVRLVEENEPSS